VKEGGGGEGKCERERALEHWGVCDYYLGVCVYYCSTYYKAVRGGGGGGWRVEDMCYERLRAEASVN
jgi:hypothetical protein